VKHSKAAGGPTELDITAGDLLVLERQDGDWWYGSTIAGDRAGYFPANYVEIKKEAVLPPPPSYVVAGPTATALAALAGSSTGAGTGAVEKNALGKVPINPKNIGLDGRRFIFDGIPTRTPVPIWQVPAFMDIFADSYKRKLIEKDAFVQLPAVKRIGFAMEIVYKALSFVQSGDQGERQLAVISKAMHLFKDGYELCEIIPVHSNDPVRFFSFLVQFMSRVKNMRAGDSILVPTVVTNPADEKEREERMKKKGKDEEDIPPAPEHAVSERNEECLM
jgi:hypothetical protein